MGYDLVRLRAADAQRRATGCCSRRRGRVNIRLARYARDDAADRSDAAAATPAAPSAAPTCAIWPSTSEMLGAQLASLHNLHFYLN